MNSLCETCIKPCKQDFLVKVVRCPSFEKISGGPHRIGHFRPITAPQSEKEPKEE
jgi:hypothetical protein